MGEVIGGNYVSAYSGDQIDAILGKANAYPAASAGSEGQVPVIQSGVIAWADQSGGGGSDANLAPVEESSTASQAYDAGALFLYNGLLYKATAAIAQGGTITPGTNCVATTVVGTYCPPLYQYDGKNLETAFADEIAASPYNGDVWAWLKGRLTAQNIDGIFVKDYINVTCLNNSSNEVTLKMQVADINHDLGYMDTELTAWHIDFISSEGWPEYHVWNKTNYNNGISAEKHPWLASDLYYFLNSLSGSVPNGTSADPATTAVDYTSTGVYDKLPSALKSVIIERRNWEPERYTSGSLLTSDNSASWTNLGKLWIPNEIEFYDNVVWGTRSGYNFGTSHLFPIFADGKMRIVRINGNRAYGWIRTSSAVDATAISCAYINSRADTTRASNSAVAALVCFRVSA